MRPTGSTKRNSKVQHSIQMLIGFQLKSISYGSVFWYLQLKRLSVCIFKWLLGKFHWLTRTAHNTRLLLLSMRMSFIYGAVCLIESHLIWMFYFSFINFVSNRFVADNILFSKGGDAIRAHNIKYSNIASCFVPNLFTMFVADGQRYKWGCTCYACATIRHSI